MNRNCYRSRSSSGSSLIEFALILPMLCVLFLNAVNFGGFIFAWITLANGARSGADYMVTGAQSIGSPAPPSVAQITTVVTADVYSLLNRGTAVVNACMHSPSDSASAWTWNVSGTACTSGYSAPTAESDTDRPEAYLYTTGWVDVNYTYQPFIAAGKIFPGLGLYITLPSNLVIHRRAIMRLD